MHKVNYAHGLLDFFRVRPLIEQAVEELGLHGMLHVTVEKLMSPKLQRLFASEQRSLPARCLLGVYHANLVHFVGAWSMERLLAEEGEVGKQKRQDMLKEFTSQASNQNIFLSRGTDSLVHGSVWRLAQHVFVAGSRVAVDTRLNELGSRSMRQLQTSVKLRSEAATEQWRTLLDELEALCLHRGGHLLQACLHGIGHGAFYAVATLLPESPLANFSASRVLWAEDCRDPPPKRELLHTLRDYGNSALHASLAICSAAPSWEYRRGCDNGVLHSAARHGYRTELSWLRPKATEIASPANYEAAVNRCRDVADTAECEAFVMGCGTPNGGASVGQLSCQDLSKLDCRKLPVALQQGCLRHVWRSRIWRDLQLLIKSRKPGEPVMSLVEQCTGAAIDLRGSATTSMAFDITSWGSCLDGAFDALPDHTMEGGGCDSFFLRFFFPRFPKYPFNLHLLFENDTTSESAFQ